MNQLTGQMTVDAGELARRLVQALSEVLRLNDPTMEDAQILGLVVQVVKVKFDADGGMHVLSGSDCVYDLSLDNAQLYTLIENAQGALAKMATNLKERMVEPPAESTDDPISSPPEPSIPDDPVPPKSGRRLRVIH